VTKAALATAVSTQPAPATPEPTTAAYPAADATIDAYPGGVLPTEAVEPYPDGGETMEPAFDSAYPAEGDLSPAAPQAGIILATSQDLSERLSVDAGDISLVSTEEMEWPDGSWGCPDPEMNYIQVITPGYLIVLEADGQEYEYHTDLNGNFVLCSDEGKPVP
jgi:hypothetical protein